MANAIQVDTRGANQLRVYTVTDGTYRQGMQPWVIRKFGDDEPGQTLTSPNRPTGPWGPLDHFELDTNRYRLLITGSLPIQ